MAKTIAQLDAEILDCTNKMQAILDAATNNRLSAEQKTAYDAIAETLGQVDANNRPTSGLLLEKQEAADAVERQKKLLASSEKSAQLSGIIGAAPQRRTQPDPLTLANQRDAFLDDPKRGFKSHKDFLLCAMNAGMTGKIDDPRLRSLAAGADEHSTVSDPHGGFLLPVGFAPDPKMLAPEGDPTAGRTMPVPMATQQITINARVDKNHTTSVSGGLRVYRRGETDTVDSSRTEMEQVVLTATALFGVAYATEELLARSPVSFIALLQAGFNSEFAAKLLKEKLYGTGAGQMLGITNSACRVSQSKETGQPAATIVKENIDKMRSRCWGYGNSIWLYNHDCLPQLRSLVQAVGTGGSAVNYFSTDVNGNSTLDGRPAFASEFCKTLGTEGDLILGNWSEYLEGTLTGQQSDESIHVRFLNHERTFKFWMENDGKPWWTSALTPNQSSVTLSPFVTLAVRA